MKHKDIKVGDIVVYGIVVLGTLEGPRVACDRREGLRIIHAVQGGETVAVAAEDWQLLP